ncbi:peroxisomal biogenesis factor 11 PEX11 [Nitzschia inconspicua]|uniref:Peroxisomal biogenesis factor 11 PEX11 n=1 Tax=Nitzschia inconspicua TaxID=303405 RepID=A0A9K3PJD9_9STRA|nr:peroxisomal biogenesis factor 11 PEX11 [Nitzschia inconspicua]
MPPAGNSHSNNHNNNSNNKDDDDDDNEKNNKMTDKHKRHESDDEEEEDIPAARSSVTSSEDDSDPVMISPHASPDKPSLLVDKTTTVADKNNVTDRFEDSIQVPDTPMQKTAVAAASPPSFITTGLQKKASPWKIENWIALSLTLDGRDKITKTLSYVSRLMAWWILAYGAKTAFNKHQSLRFTNFYKALANSRKAFRLGRSITEAHKIASMGLVGVWCWHLKKQIEKLEGVQEASDDSDGTESQQKQNKKPPVPLVRRASSNIGWGPMTLEESDGTIAGSTRALVRSASNMAYRKMYRPMISRVSSTLAAAAASETPASEWWMATGSALKMLGLLGFWLGDNVNYLSSSGALDNYTFSQEERASRRQRWQTFASHKANQAYFMGAIAGLVTNAYAYHRFRKDKLAHAKKEYQESLQQSSDEEPDKEEQKHTLNQLKKLQEKQFVLFLALLKSCVDVTVFSNNPGIDLHQKFRGKKNHEGFHCLCGLISAGTVLYNNFPDAKK